VISLILDSLIENTKMDWDSYERSWDFESLPLLNEKCRMNNEELPLTLVFNSVRQKWMQSTLEMQRLEEENNRIFIEAYGLQEELTPEVPLKEITLTCNPYYRYGKDADESAMEKVKCKMENGEVREYPLNEELEERLKADTMKEFISYAVGCMFGRYSLDKPGLILANAGETVADYIRKVKGEMGEGKQEISFLPVETNVLPILEGNWFTDDIVERFKEFLKVSFGYLHRYNKDTISIVLNNYLREYQTKLNAKVEYLSGLNVSYSVSAKEKTKALKEKEKLNKIIAELNSYEKDILYPMATQQIEIDLDDGVKVNYNKFGKALQKVAGLSKK